MALTPEEVVNKRFQPTKFREGYDQDEVDDFLDEVVNELRRLTTESDDLRQKLTACERRVGELSRAGASTGDVGASTGERTAVAPVVPESSKPESSKPESPEQSKPEQSKPVDVAKPQSEPAPEPVSPAAASPRPAAVTGGEGPEAATGMLALAQRLHDEHVKSGEQQRDKLVAEAQEHAGRLVHEAVE